jgi:hypothetical protein
MTSIAQDLDQTYKTREHDYFLCWFLQEVITKLGPETGYFPIVCFFSIHFVFEGTCSFCTAFLCPRRIWAQPLFVAADGAKVPHTSCSVSVRIERGWRIHSGVLQAVYMIDLQLQWYDVQWPNTGGGRFWWPAFCPTEG